MANKLQSICLWLLRLTKFCFFFSSYHTFFLFVFWYWPIEWHCALSCLSPCWTLPGSFSECCVLHCPPAVPHTPCENAFSQENYTAYFWQSMPESPFVFRQPALCLTNYISSHLLCRLFMLHVFSMLNFNSAWAWAFWSVFMWNFRHKICQNGEKDQTTPRACLTEPSCNWGPPQDVSSTARLQTVLLPKNWESFLSIFLESE